MFYVSVSSIWICHHLHQHVAMSISTFFIFYFQIDLSIIFDTGVLFQDSFRTVSSYLWLLRTYLDHQSELQREFAADEIVCSLSPLKPQHLPILVLMWVRCRSRPHQHILLRNTSDWLNRHHSSLFADILRCGSFASAIACSAIL